VKYIDVVDVTDYRIRTYNFKYVNIKRSDFRPVKYFDEKNGDADKINWFISEKEGTTIFKGDENLATVSREREGFFSDYPLKYVLKEFSREGIPLTVYP